MSARLGTLLDRVSDPRVLPALIAIGIAGLFLAWVGLPTPGPLTVLWLCAVPLAVVTRVSPRADRAVLTGIVAAAIAIRLVIAAVIDIVLADAVFGLFDDTVRYQEIGRVMADAWRAHGNADIYALYQLSVAGYFYIVAGLDLVCGGGPFLIAAFNAMLAGLTVPVIYWLAAELRATRPERLLATAVGTFMPSLVLWSAIPLKDSLVTAAFCLGILASFKLASGRGIRPAVWIAALAIAIAVVASVRLYATFFLGLSALLGLIVTGAWRRRPAWALASLVVVAVVQFWALQGPVGTLIATVATDVNELDRIRGLFDQGGSSANGKPGSTFSVSAVTPRPATTTAPPRTTPSPEPTTAPPPSASAVVVASPTGSSQSSTAPPTAPATSTASAPATASAPPTASTRSAPPSAAPSAPSAVSRYVALVARIPLSVAQFLVLPIPLITTGTTVKYAIPEMLIWYALLPFAIVGMLILWRRDRARTAALALLVVAVAALYGTFVGNAGSILRYRSQEIILLAIPIGVGVVTAWRAWRARRTAAGD